MEKDKSSFVGANWRKNDWRRARHGFVKIPFGAARERFTGTNMY
jgi:hypothetical protein